MYRIASLLPSATEIICALGFGDQLVGRSHECDHPPSVTHLPVLTMPKFDPEGSSREVDQRVKQILADALSVYRVDADQLRSLTPDVIVTQSQCEVCAVSMRDVEQAVAQWLGDSSATRPMIISLAPASLHDILSDMEHVASELGAAERGIEIVGELSQRMKSIEQRAAHLPEQPAVACIEWIDPLMAAGNWMPELVAMAGGRNLFGTAGQHSPWMSFDELMAKNPDVILIAPCGFNMERTTVELPALVRHPGWPRLDAVRSGRVYLADGNQFFNRPGPRIVESLEILAEMLHPEVFDFGHQGACWRSI